MSNRMTLKEKRERALSLLESLDDVTNLVARISNDVDLRYDSRVISSIVKREKDILRIIRNSTRPWSIIDAVLWIQDICSSKGFLTETSRAISKTDSPWYIVNLLKSQPRLLHSKQVQSAISKALENSQSFWLFLDHLRSDTETFQSKAIQKSLQKRLSRTDKDIDDSATPLSVIQSLKVVPEAFRQKSVKQVIENIIVNHPAPWDVIRSIEDIPETSEIIHSQRVLDVIETHAFDIVDRMKKSSESDRILENAIKIPEIARTETLREALIERILSYWYPSIAIGNLDNSNELSGNNDVQEAVARALITSPEPWHIIRAVSYNDLLLQSSSVTNAIELRSNDVISSLEPLKEMKDISLLFDIVGVIERVPRIGESEEMIEAMATCIAESTEPDYILKQLLKKTRYGDHETIQRAIALAIEKSPSPVDIINQLTGKSVMEVTVIRQAIQSRADDIIQRTASGDSGIEQSGILTELIGENQYEEAIVERLLTSDKPEEMMREILKTTSQYTSVTIQNGIAKALREPDIAFEILSSFWGTSVSKAASIIMSNPIVQLAIADYVRTTEKLTAALDKISSIQDLWLLIVNPAFRDALKERVADIVKTIKDSSRPQYIIKGIKRFPFLCQNERIERAVASRIQEPYQFEDLMDEVRNYWAGYPPGFRESDIINAAISKSGGVLLELLRKKKKDGQHIFSFLMDKYNPSMLKNRELVQWFSEHIPNPDLDLFKSFLNPESIIIADIADAIIALMKQMDEPLYLALSIFERQLYKENEELDQILQEQALKAFTLLQESKTPWKFNRFIPLLKRYIDSEEIDRVLLGAVSDVASSIMTAQHEYEIKEILSAILDIDLWKSNSGVIAAVATNIKEEKIGSWERYLIAKDDILSTQNEIRIAFADVIRHSKDPKSIVEYIPNNLITSTSPVREAILDRFDVIVDGLKQSEKPCRYIESLSYATFIFEDSRLHQIISEMIDDIVEYVGGQLTYFGIDKILKVHQIVSHPAVLERIVTGISKTYIPWEIIGAIKSTEILLTNDDIMKAMQSRVEYIATMISQVPDPGHITRSIEGVPILMQNKMIVAAIQERGVDL